MVVSFYLLIANAFSKIYFFNFFTYFITKFDNGNIFFSMENIGLNLNTKPDKFIYKL